MARRNLYWKVPSMTALCLALGVGFALGHHFFYSHLDQRVVGNAAHQQWVTRAGNAAAFIVKLSLTTITSAAYTQWLWLHIRNNPSKMQRLDTMFDVLGNAWQFLDLRFWIYHPMLALPAVITWLLPLSAIFTPGTIVVRPSVFTTQQPLTIYQRDYITGGYATYENDSVSTTMIGFPTNLNPALVSTMAQGMIAPVPWPQSNANITYSAGFNAPALSCSRADNLTESYVNAAFEEYQNSIQATLVLASFVPQPGFGPGMNGSFFNDSSAFHGPTMPNSYLDVISQDSSKVYIRVAQPSDKAMLISCAYYNASYLVNFDLRSQGQNITVTTNFLNWITAKVKIPGPPSDPSVSQTLSYQGIMFTMAAYLNGEYTEPFNQSQVGRGDMIILQDSPEILYRALNTNSTTGPGALISTLESMMHNYTISMRYSAVNVYLNNLLDRGIISNTSTNATYYSFRNQYSYNPRDLVIAYGLSIFWAIICIGLGAMAISRNSGSYSNIFSTIVRATRDSELDRLIEEGDDRSGMEPLPQHIARITLRFGSENWKLQTRSTQDTIVEKDTYNVSVKKV